MTNLETTTISQTVILPAKPVQVYDAFVNPVKHAQFTGAHATGEHRSGAPFSAYDGYISGTHLTLDRGRRIVQHWLTADWPLHSSPSILELTFLHKDGGTEVVMNHSGVPLPLADACRQGWYQYYWSPLLEYFEKTQTSLDDPLPNIDLDHELNRMILARDFLHALQRFYAANLFTPQNTSLPAFLHSIAQLHNIQLIGAASNGETSYSEWEFHITPKDTPHHPVTTTQISARRWKNGKVIRERNYSPKT